MTMKKTVQAKTVLKFNNQILKPEEYVSNVLKFGYVDQEEIPFKYNYIVATESVDEKQSVIDTRSVDELLKDIEGPIQEKSKVKKKKTKNKNTKVNKHQKNEGYLDLDKR